MRTVIMALCALLLGMAATAAAAPIRLVGDHSSAWTIYHEANAPSSVVMAAAELQDYLLKATGARLPIVHEPRTAMISLGENAASRQAGLVAKGIPLEGFRIVTKAGNVYILGPDTADDELTPQGGKSTGTRNGAYAFLEKFLGVRWLVPGPHGDYVPKSATVVIPDTELTDAPFFQNRRVPYTQQDRPEVKRWWARQRLGWSLYLNHSHHWDSIAAAEFDRHPDWFAERGGKRVPPTGRYKLCVTNPGLVRAFADRAIAHFDKHPEATCYSLSPSDSSGWCECEKCTALYEKDPNDRRSVTPAILTFYNDVAKLVAEKYPQKVLAGYVYAEYVFPPKQPIPLARNVFLVWAPSFDYGYTLFRPSLRQQWEELLPQWTRVTENIAYYDLPVNISTQSGALNPPGLKILKFLYPRLKAARMKGVYVYGIEAWGRGGPLNFLLARLAWDPDADVEALFDEYCQKAYGEGGDDINRLLRLLDAELERHYQEYPNARYTLTTDMMRDVYARNLEQIERLYRSAESKVVDADAKARLAMIGDNLTAMHWNLRQFSLVQQPQKSSFYLPDKEFFRLLSDRKRSLALEPDEITKTPSYLKKRLMVSAAKVPKAEPVTRFSLRGNQHLLLLPTGQGTAKVRFRRISSRGALITYSVHSSTGQAIGSGLMSKDVPIELESDASPYYHLSISAGTASLMVEIEGAAWAVDATMSDQGLHLLNHVTPLYFHVPEGVASFTLSLGATPPGEPALATLYSPAGRAAAEFDCTSTPVDRQTVPVGTRGAGWWRLTIRAAPPKLLDDVWVKLGSPLTAYFSLVPEQALEVSASAP